MTAVLPHAPPSTVASQPKSGHALAKAGSRTDHHEPVTKSKFQVLLEQSAPKPAVPPGHLAFEKAPAAKTKTPEHVPEKAKASKKENAHEVKNELADTTPMAGLQIPVKPEMAPKTTKSNEAETATAEKAKNLKDERRTVSSSGQVAAWNPGSLETTRPGVSGQAASSRHEKSEEKQKIFVVDRRTESKEKDKLKLPGAEGAAQQPVNSTAEILPRSKDGEAKTEQVQVTFQTVSGKGQGQGSFDVQAQNTQVSPRDAASFQQYLVERGYGQMVDQARIVLKDQNAGEIRMTLYPESLGKVKVALNLSDNSLDGRIFVENQSVKDVFQSNMDNLLQAFRDGGWNDLSLEVSVGGDRGSGNGGSAFGQAPQAKDYGRQVAQTVSSEGQPGRIGSWNDRQINLTA